MAVAQKLQCAVERIVDHGEHVYTLVLRPDRPAPRFRAGQFLHLALDPYDPTGFWPESRVFSIASSPDDRSAVRVTYAVHGQFTARMESEIREGGRVWIKMPYGDFVIDSPGDVVLFAGGTGISAFTAYLEALSPPASDRSYVLGYGARTAELLIYKDVVDRSAARVPALDVTWFVETGAIPSSRIGDPTRWLPGRVSVAALWTQIRRPRESDFYISGPPAMLAAVAADLRARQVAPEAIHIDAWE
ncbi:MAG TPA: FAD-dependent oxidoreductase [Vicinamibacterales bacterium]|nr:FAD-dependent oxidoreductase [Vicinamibacterales bacterium]